MMKEKLSTDEKHKNTGTLKSSGDALKQKISDLSAKRDVLLAELKQVEDALSKPNRKKVSCQRLSSFWNKNETPMVAKLCS